LSESVKNKDYEASHWSEIAFNFVIFLRRTRQWIDSEKKKLAVDLVDLVDLVDETVRVYTLSGKLCPRQETMRLTAVRDQHALMECSWRVQSGYFLCGIPGLEVRRSPALKLSLSARSREKGLRISSRD
jgi:hypothetical protein